MAVNIKNTIVFVQDDELFKKVYTIRGIHVASGVETAGLLVLWCRRAYGGGRRVHLADGL